MEQGKFSHINLEYLHLMSDGDIDMEQTILAMLIDEIPTEIALMRTAFDEGNFNALKEVSHKMKSTLSFIGNPQMTAANSEIEMLCKSSMDSNRIGELMPVMEKFMPLVLADLKECIPA